MNYYPDFIKNISIEEIDEEIKKYEDDRYSYGRSIPKTRIWDLKYTRKILEDYNKAHTIEDYINNNDGESKIRISVQDDIEPCNPTSHEIWEGKLKDIPEQYRHLKVIWEGFLIGAQLNQLTVFSDDVYGITVGTKGDYPYFASILDPYAELEYKKDYYFEDKSDLSFVTKAAYSLVISYEQRQYMLHHIPELEQQWNTIVDMLQEEYKAAKYEELMAAYNMGGYGEDEANARLMRDIERYRPDPPETMQASDLQNKINPEEGSVATNIGNILVKDYLDIKAAEAGYDSYEDMKNDGLSISL